MGSLSVQRAVLACMLITQCFALNVRQAGFNATTSEIPVTSPSAEDDQSSAHRVIVQTSVMGFEDVATTTEAIFTPQPTPSEDIWAIIKSELDLENPNDVWSLFTPHFEVKETGFVRATDGEGLMTAAAPQEHGGEPTTGAAVVAPTTGTNVLAPTTGATVVAPTATITNSGRTLTPVPQSQVVIGSQTLTAGGSTATWVDNGATTTIHLDDKGTPILVLGQKTSTITQITPAPTIIEGQTLAQGGLPITVGSGFSATTLSINNEGKTIAVVEGVSSTIAAPTSQVVHFGSNVTATLQTGHQYVVGGSTLDLNHAVTISDTVLSLKTNALGYTMLVAGDKTTTLASPGQPTNGVATTVKDGTTQYIIGSQTLAPGHPITIDGISMAIATSAGNTVLVIGNMTTTMARTTTPVRPEPVTWTPLGSATATTKKGGAERIRRSDASSYFLIAFGLAILGLG